MGGAQVDAWVRPYQREQAEAGVTLYPLSLFRRRPAPVSMYLNAVHTEVSTVAAQPPDQIWLCVPAPALRGPWLGELLQAAPKALVVSLSPGVRDRDLLLEHCEPQRLVQGMIPIVSYQTPLEGEERPQPGVAYWVPPLIRHPFSGEREAVREASQYLGRGGWGVTYDPKLSYHAGSASALLIPMVAGLELAGWSFRELARADSTHLALNAAREAIALIAAKENRRPAPLRFLAKRWLVGTGLRLGSLAAPLPLETYFRYHFEKTGAQTRDMLEEYIALGETLQQPTPQLQELRRRLPS